LLHRLFFIPCLIGTLGIQAQEQRFQFTQQKMGSPFHLIFYAKDPGTAHLLAQLSFALIDSLNAVFSDYDPHSELNQLSATAGGDSFVRVSPLLYHLIRDSKAAWEKSKGRFDITIGPLSRLWRSARKEKTFPSDAAVQQALQNTGFDKVLIDTAAKAIKLLQPGMQLDLGGIAKGYIAQKVVSYIQAQGLPSVMADAGGDLVCGAAPPGKAGWTIGVNLPGQEEELLDKHIIIRNGAVATSGDVYQYTLHEGKKYSHIINPLTGYGVTFQRNVTVIAPEGSTADWLATACSILPLSKALKLAKREKAELLITQMHRGKLRCYATRGLKQYWSE
jgi:FAD:protein FMN transferase